MCSLSAKTLQVAARLSEQNIQSKFVSNFSHIPQLIDGLVQGFVIDLASDGFEHIFNQV